MRLLAISILLSISFTAFSQNNSANLIGEWKYEDIYGKDKLDSTSLKMVEMLFGDMSFQFNDDGMYQARLMGKEDQGTWTMSDNSNLALSSDRGEAMTFEIIQLTEETLILNIKRASITLSKVSEANLTGLSAKEVPFKTVSATKEQVVGKWYLKSKESAKNPSPEIKAAANAFLQGSYLELRKNGKYEVSIMQMEEKGTWEFGDNNESIILNVDERKNTWNIISISDNELVMIKGATSERWTFTN